MGTLKLQWKIVTEKFPIKFHFKNHFLTPKPKVRTNPYWQLNFYINFRQTHGKNAGNPDYFSDDKK